MTSWNPYSLLAQIFAATQQNGVKLDQIQATLTKGLLAMNQLDTQITALTNSVSALATVDASAVALINGFAAQMAAQLAELNALQASIDNSTGTLAAAISANTPAAPVVPPAPPAPVPAS